VTPTPAPDHVALAQDTARVWLAHGRLTDVNWLAEALAHFAARAVEKDRVAGEDIGSLLRDVGGSYHYAVKHAGRPENCGFGWCAAVSKVLRADADAPPSET